MTVPTIAIPINALHSQLSTQRDGGTVSLYFRRSKGRFHLIFQRTVPDEHTLF
jgi:hypothetical protein